MMHINRCFPILTLLLISGSGYVTNVLQAQDSTSIHQGIARIDSLVHREIRKEQIPGAVLLISHHGRVLHQAAYGYASLYGYDQKRLTDPVPLTEDFLFDLASLTKVFATTFGIMLLVDRGLVGLDDPISSHLTEFRGPHKDSVTVRHLLTHTGGLYQWEPVYYHVTNKHDAYRYVARLPLAFPVGKERRYSDLGFMLLGQLIETVSGQSLDVFIESQLYKPLGLENIAFLPRKRGYWNFAATSHGNPYERRMVADDDFGYLCDENPNDFTRWRAYTLSGEVNDGNAHHAFEGVAGHAGLFSTVGDLHKLLELLLNRGRRGANQLIREETIDRFLFSNTPDGGLGWMTSASLLGVEYLPKKSFGHTGFTGTYVLAAPTLGLSILLLTNRQNTGVLPTGYYRSVTPIWSEIVSTSIDMLSE